MTCPRDLLQAIRRHLDIDGLLAEYPHLTRAEVEGFLHRLAPPAEDAPCPPSTGSRDRVVLHVDGSALGNPGSAGLGVVLLDASGAVLKEESVYIGTATNNVAEYRAAIAGVREALALGARELTLRSDSQLLVRQVKGEYRVRNRGLAPLYAELIGLVKELDVFRCEHVPREHNARADALANAAARRGY